MAIGCLLSITALSIPTYGENKALGEQTSSSLEALEKASQYSFDTGGIGILLSYGKGNTVTADDIGNAFAQALSKQRIQSRYFFYDTTREGMAIEFHLGYSALGPWNIQTASENIKDVIARHEAMKKVQMLNID